MAAYGETSLRKADVHVLRGLLAVLLPVLLLSLLPSRTGGPLAEQERRSQPAKGRRVVHLVVSGSIHGALAPCG